MFHVVPEDCDIEFKWGFNFYPWGDPRHLGFRFKTRKSLTYFRYARKTGYFHLSRYRRDDMLRFVGGTHKYWKLKEV